ncbi:homoserine O-acetyltransferase MetX [Alteribacter natronophilus]|uniref:homoserine O-acetyltransferase MetX n=1 Tax=Alteribacter natronophilus TaxID=2583810 RepID=UPI00110DC0BC|nr:homoserine O-acetyltransferase [Alteribacter natronophilus]TMW71820.1 homoserine O-acetyltransferase [Alteribacter natronophilus]
MTVRQDRKIEAVTGTVILDEIRLESGDVIRNAEAAFERAGSRSGKTVLVCHALTGNQYTVGSRRQPGWWRGLISENGYVDLNEYEVVTFNVTGGCSGSAGPLTTNPATGKPYKSTFPFISVRDMVRIQKAALEKLGITHLHAVIGGSLGGMQVLEWVIEYPEKVDRAVVMAATPSLSDYGMAYNAIARKAITNDPKWKGGAYSAEDPPADGLALARMTGMITYRSDSLFNQRFHRDTKDGPGRSHEEVAYQVESYLLYQGDKFTRRFDANSYLYLLKAMDGHDLERGREKPLRQLLAGAKVPATLIGFKKDLLYPAEEMARFASLWNEAGGRAVFHEVDTVFGHDGFLTEYSRWGNVVKEALRKTEEEKAE